MLKPLLIEIGVEELPALPLLKVLDSIQKSWVQILQDRALLCEFEFFYTPRRLVLWHPEFLTKQEDKEIELWGPPLDVAYKDGTPTQAAIGFAKKCGTDIQNIEYKSKKGREFLYHKSVQKGQKSSDLLQDMLQTWLQQMAFGKMMRWGSMQSEFIRPVRWLQIRFVGEQVDVELFGVKNRDITYGHRSVGYEPIAIDGYQAYFYELATNGVTLYQDKRRQKILDDFDKLQNDYGITVDHDKALLDEVVAITENPNALLGEFDKEFLKLPDEVIITSMKEHQRYFPVFENGELTNRFVVVSNALTDDFSQVIAGNERVLRPRLADAIFFYENDLKNGLDTTKLQDIGFMQGLGTVQDKVEREKQIGTELAKRYGLEESKVVTAIELAKADLTTEMVDEFGKLQGLMGYYYAKALGYDAQITQAIKQQYLPLGENSPLPSSEFSAVVALCNKIDSLMALFSIGKVPTGSKDPFALRRAVNGIIQIVLHYRFAFNIRELFEQLQKGYKSFDLQLLEEFFIERVYKTFKVNRSIITAVINSGERDIVKIADKVSALQNIVNSEGFEDVLATFKRVANISKDLPPLLEVDETLFQKQQEKALFTAFVATSGAQYDGYEQKLDALFGLKKDLDEYFDNVLINCEDQKLQKNRLHTIGSIYRAFKEVADIKEISV